MGNMHVGPALSYMKNCVGRCRLCNDYINGAYIALCGQVCVCMACNKEVLLYYITEGEVPPRDCTFEYRGGEREDVGLTTTLRDVKRLGKVVGDVALTAALREVKRLSKKVGVYRVLERTSGDRKAK